jgi:hypothetical protein
LRTNWSEAARISSSVAGGSKLKSVFMLRHMVKPEADATPRAAPAQGLVRVDYAAEP